MTNRVREVRKEVGISQTELAKGSGTSVAHIRQIEAGLRSIPKKIAEGIAETLEAPFVRVFPQTPTDIDDPKHAKLLSDPSRSEMRFETFMKLVKPVTHFSEHTPVNAIQVYFENGQRFLLAVTDEEQERLDHVLNDLPRRSDFIVIDALDHVIAVNPQHITRIQMLIENSGHETKSLYLSSEDGDWAEMPDEGLAWFSPRTPEVEVINVEPDFLPEGLDDEDPHLFSKFYGLENAEKRRMFSFEDVDGEREYINTNEIAAVCIHRMYLADYWDIWNEEEDLDPPRARA